MGKSKGSKITDAETKAPAKCAPHITSPGIQKTSGKEQASVPKKKSFIDDLFTNARTTSKAERNSEKSGETAVKYQSTPAKSGKGKKDDLFGLVEEARKKTEEGWNVYSEDFLFDMFDSTKLGLDLDLCGS